MKRLSMNILALSRNEISWAEMDCGPYTEDELRDWLYETELRNMLLRRGCYVGIVEHKGAYHINTYQAPQDIDEQSIDPLPFDVLAEPMVYSGNMSEKQVADLHAILKRDLRHLKILDV